MDTENLLLLMGASMTEISIKIALMGKVSISLSLLISLVCFRDKKVVRWEVVQRRMEEQLDEW